MVAGRYLPRGMARAFSELGTTSERVKALLTLHGNPEYASHWDDFFGDGLDARYAADFGAGTQVVGVTAAVGGTATLTTQGNQAADSAGLALGRHWSADLGFYFIARCKLSAITASKLEIGMVGATSGDTGAVATKATPTFNITDVAVFAFDTTEDTNLTFVSNGGATDANADWGALSADTFVTVEIVGGGPTATTGDNVTGYVNNKRVGSGKVDGSASLSPWAYVEQVGGAAARTLTIDYWGIVGRRSF